MPLFTLFLTCDLRSHLTPPRPPRRSLTCRCTPLPLLFLLQPSSLLTSLQSSSEVPSAAELVSAIEKLVKTKMVSGCWCTCMHVCVCGCVHVRVKPPKFDFLDRSRNAITCQSLVAIM